MVGTRPNVGPNYYLAYMADLVGPVASFRPEHIALYGRIIIKGEVPQVSVYDRSGQPHTSTVKWVPADPHAVSPPPGRQIEIDSDCTRSTCELVVQTSSARQAIALVNVADHQVLASPDFDLTIDYVRRSGPAAAPPATEKRRDIQLAIAHTIARVYATTMPFLSALALIGLLIAMIVRPAIPGFSRILTLALACAAAIASRAALLCYHEVTTLPGAINVLYLSPATPFLLVFVTLGFYLGGQSIFAIYGARRQQNRVGAADR